MSDLTEYWDERARSHPPEFAVGFLGGPVENRFYRRAHVHTFRRHILPLVAEAARAHGRAAVLEVGCGWGRWARALTRWLGPDKIDYLGVDASAAMIERARAMGSVPGAELVHASATEFVVTRPVDVAFSFTVLQHVPYTDQLVALRRMLASLRPDGVLVLVELLGERQEAFHVFPRSESGWRAAVEEAGGRVVGLEKTMRLRAEVVSWGRSRWGDRLNHATNLVKLALYPALESARGRVTPAAGSHVVVRAVRPAAGGDGDVLS